MNVIKMNMEAGVNKLSFQCSATVYMSRGDFSDFIFLSVELRFLTLSLSHSQSCHSTSPAAVPRPQWRLRREGHSGSGALKTWSWHN